jgi:hypothetical protein
MHPNLYWAIILVGCLLALAVVWIPEDVGVLNKHDNESSGN